MKRAKMAHFAQVSAMARPEDSIPRKKVRPKRKLGLPALSKDPDMKGVRDETGGPVIDSGGRPRKRFGSRGPDLRQQGPNVGGKGKVGRVGNSGRNDRRLPPTNVLACR